MPSDEQHPPVRKSVTVRASVPQAFEIFTADFDSWWPRGHHIGDLPMRKAIIESRLGGRCYSEQIDGTECDWGQVLAWEPHLDRAGVSAGAMRAAIDSPKGWGALLELYGERVTKRDTATSNSASELA